MTGSRAKVEETVEIIRAQEAFLNMIADAVKWEEEGDEDGIYYHLTTRHEQLEALMEALGLNLDHLETPGMALDRYLSIPPKAEGE
jgi:hypothetical protein